MSSGQGQDLDISNTGGGAGSHGTQTREGEGGGGGGDTKAPITGDKGAGTGQGDGAGSGEGADVFTPDAEGKYTHPESKEKVDLATIAKYYHGQFGASTKGAQELLGKVSTAEGERDTFKGQVAKLTKDMEDLRAIAEGKNPDGVKAADVQAKLAETSEKLALLTEKGNLDDFEKSTPLATGQAREALKALARSNPSATLQSLWDANLKAGAVAADTKRKADEEAAKKGAGDQGKGTSTRELGGGSNTVRGAKGDTGKTLEEFNALPVAQRRQLIEKFDIRM